MKRPYLALATLALVASLSPSPTLLPRAWGEALFASAPVEPASFAVLGRPVGSGDWTLVVLEQLRARPFCWTPRPDGLVDPTLNRFDYTGICGRFIDSNGYSLRVSETDLGHAYRLRLEQRGGELQLLASSPSQPTELVVGRGAIPRRDRDLFVSLQLEPGWQLQRRMFGGRSLNHIYFSNAQPLDTLIAASRGRASDLSGQQAAMPLLPPPSMATPPTSRVTSRRPAEPLTPVDLATRGRGLRPLRQSERLVNPAARGGSADGARADGPGADGPGLSEASAPSSGPGVVALQVIPYEERMSADGRSQAVPDGQAQAQGL